MFEINSTHDPSRIRRHINTRFYELWRDSSTKDDSQHYEVIPSQNIERWGIGEWEDASPLYVSRSNSQKFLGREFFTNPDIVALGCSVTAPVGMPFEFSWANIIGTQTGKKVNVIAFPGAGIQRITAHFFAHIRKYGIPQKVYFLIPDFERVQLYHWSTRRPHDKSHQRWDALNASYEETDLYYQDPATGGRGKVGKPLVLRDVFGRPFEIPVEVALTQVVTMLHILVDFCAVSGIELKIASWHNRTQSSIASIGDDEFIKSPFVAALNGTCAGCFVPTTTQIETGEFDDAKCHRPENNIQEAFWLLGHDIPNPHPGFHPHIHYAEAFLGHEVNQDVIKSIIATTNIE